MNIVLARLNTMLAIAKANGDGNAEGEFTSDIRDLTAFAVTPYILPEVLTSTEAAPTPEPSMADVPAEMSAPVAASPAPENGPTPVVESAPELPLEGAPPDLPVAQADTADEDETPAAKETVESLDKRLDRVEKNQRG